MSSASLSQNEIDLLFSGGGANKSAEPVVARPVDVQVYDFRKPARISKERSRSLLAMYGLLAKSMEGWLAGRTREQIDVELQSVEQLTFGEFVLALPSPCASFVVDVGGPERQGIIDIGHDLSYFIVDRFLGGMGVPASPARTLSTLERKVVRIMAERVAGLLTEAWKDYVRLGLEVTGFESIPEMLRVANQEDPVLVGNLIVSAGEMTSQVMLCLPFASVEKFFTGTKQRRREQAEGSPEERHRDRLSIQSTVSASRFSLSARWPAFDASVSGLSLLKPGDVLPTPVSPTAPVELHIAGQRRFLALPGRSGRNLAVQVTDHVRPMPPESIDVNREVALTTR